MNRLVLYDNKLGLWIIFFDKILIIRVLLFIVFVLFISY